jgi:fibronectin-binding autotransporter adhesin
LNYAGKFDATFSHDGSAAPSLKSIHVDHSHAHAPANAIIVPDAHFLFNADFKRSGVDLILSGDNRELVLHDYFKGEKRAALASPDGAHLTGDVVTALTGHVEISQAGTSPAAGQVIGHLTKLQGTATAIRNGVSIILNNGDNVEKGDVVEAGSNSTVGITFIDGTVFGLSSNARMVLNEMVYDPNGSNNSTLFNLVAGTISFVAGQTAKHGDMKIDTPVATMGIRGTAVLVQIDFSIPGQAGVPNASFQVLVEPDGTTGSYVLFDKTTLQPIATVNQAGQQININNGVISQSNAPLSPDVQKLIQDVFTQKFTDNSNTKQNSPFNDTLNPLQQGSIIKLADGSTAIPNYVILKVAGDPDPQNSNGPSTTLQHIPGPPTVVVADGLGVVTTSFGAGELVGKTAVTDLDVVQGVVRFVDVNAGDLPTVKVEFNSFSYQSAAHTDVTANLSPLQLADIAATEISITVDPASGNKNSGSATWTYSISDKAFDFLAAGEQLTLTYMVRVDNNYAPSNETKFVPITITITGTNDAPVFTTSSPTITFSGGTSMGGGNLPSGDATSGTLSFQDVDLTDTHTVSPPVLADALLNGSELSQNERDLFANALTASIETDSTGTGNGVVEWKLADLSADLADFIPKGETLVLTYTITVTDSHGATATQTITINISNPAEKWIATAAPGSASGGLWRVGENWATGAAPTANDDAIIITDQPNGLTPTFPVTIDAPAAAKSLVMNDFREANDFSGVIDSIVSSNSDDLQPILINLSTLDIGAGGLSVSADAIVKNYGTITVAGAAEFNSYSELLNSGTFKLGSGGTFVDQSRISNTAAGTIEVLGGTLNVSVEIANSGQVEVDHGAALALNAGAIDGGTVAVHGTLQLEGQSFLQNGSLTNDGEVDIGGSGNVLDSEVVANFGGLIDVSGDPTLTPGTSGLPPPATLTLKNGTAIQGGLLTVGIAGILEISSDFGASLSAVNVDNSGVIEIDTGSLLALSQTTITGGTLTDLGTIHVTGTSDIGGTHVTIAKGGVLEVTSGKLTIESAGANVGITNDGTLKVSGGELDIVHETVTNADGTVSVAAGSTLDLVNSIISGGAVGIDGTLKAIGHSAIDGATVDVADSGVLSVGLTSTLDLVDTIIKDGTINVAGTLDASGNSEIDGAAICNTGVLEVTGGTLTIDATSSIDNKGIVEANGGNLIIDTGLSGTAEIGGTSTLELGAGGKDAYSGLEIEFANHSSATLKLDHAEYFAGEISNLDDDDSIDLADIALRPGATVSFCGDANGGTLTITSNGEVSHLKLEGDYLGSSWSLADDGSGGIRLTEVPGALSGLDSHDNAVEGKAITVSITDGGAPVTDPTYTFETSVNGKDWTTVQTGSNNSYTPTEADEGKQLKVVMSFTDHEGNQDTSSISAGTVQEAPDAHPVILSETDPATQTIILSESPIVLPQGAFENSLGLHTENFDNTPAGSNSFSHGDFFSSALNATFSASGAAGVFTGSSGVSAAPFIGPLPGQQDTTHYMSVGANGAETISFATEQNAFGLYWGSVDPSNKIEFYHGNTLVASYSGSDISPLLASGGQGSFASNGYVEFKDLAPFDKVVLSSATNSFELDNVSSGYIADSHIRLDEPITGTLTVHDDDVGDHLTASVIGPAVIKYNGSTTLPAGINVDALINPSAVTFDSTTSDGGSDTLHWSYNPTGYNLDFLEPGDTLTITFNAQVSDGHVVAGNQPLTITLTGTGSSVVNGTAQDDVFDHVGGGVSIFGHGGNDTFVFNANFGSATIGDFDLNHDTIKFDGVFESLDALFAAAQPSNAGHDTVITDANHDKLVLTGVSVADLKAHPNDFHLV